ncbi:MAG: Phosphoribosylglycinamide formyltransferase [Verrucomicrobiae bacterium]|nr:Phosphoribosylglycinamide formyltransferase [Verrucomicrobiae bacterium]
MTVEQPLRIGILGSGNGSNCEAILRACASGQLPGQVAAVISDSADALILQRARQRNIPATFVGPSQFKTKLEPELEQQIVSLLHTAKVNLVVLAGYMRVVKSPLLTAFAGRIINVHPSLLPAFPGLKAWEQALNYGARVTGVTVHFVNEGIDAGPVILQQPLAILPDDTAESLHQRIQIVEHTLLPEAIRLFALGKLQITGRRVQILE